MGFDPSQPFEIVETPQATKSGFDPSKPFEVVEAPRKPSTPEETGSKDILGQSQDAYGARSSRVAAAARSGWDSAPPILTPKGEKLLRDKGLGDRAIAFIQAQNFGPRILNALARGTQQQIQEFLTPVLGPQLARDVAAYPEAFAGMPENLGIKPGEAPSPRVGRRNRAATLEEAGLTPTPPGEPPAPITGPQPPPAPTTQPPGGGAAPPSGGRPRSGGTLEEAGIKPTFDPEPGIETQTVAEVQPDGTVRQVQMQVGTGEPPPPAPPASPAANLDIVKAKIQQGLITAQRHAEEIKSLRNGGATPEMLAPAIARNRQDLEELQSFAEQVRDVEQAATPGEAAPAAAEPDWYQEYLRGVRSLVPSDWEPVAPAASEPPAPAATVAPSPPADEGKKPKEAEAAPIEAHGGPWTPVLDKEGKPAKNRQGEPVFENANGVRALMENGVPYHESATMDPEKGLVPKSAVDRRGQFLTSDETGLGAAPPKKRDEAKKPGDGNSPENIANSPTETGTAKKPDADWKRIGENEEGDPLFANDQGVHSIVKDGVRIVEKVRLRPTKGGMEMSVPPPDQKEMTFRPVAEPAEKKNTSKSPRGETSDAGPEKKEPAVRDEPTSGSPTTKEGTKPEALSPADQLEVRKKIEQFFRSDDLEAWDDFAKKWKQALTDFGYGNSHFGLGTRIPTTTRAIDSDPPNKVHDMLSAWRDSLNSAADKARVQGLLDDYLRLHPEEAGRTPKAAEPEVPVKSTPEAPPASTPEEKPSTDVAKPETPTEHPGLRIKSLETGKETVIQPIGTVPPKERVPQKIGDHYYYARPDGTMSGPFDTIADLRNARPVTEAESAPAVAAPESVPTPGQTEPEIVTHVTKKGKTLTGTIRRDIDRDEAKALDPYTFRRDGGWFIRTPESAAKPKTPAKAKPGVVTDAMLAEYFTPGEIVHGYGGTRDKVIAFRPSTKDQYWSVDVQEVGKDGTLGRLRNHMTMPTMREVEQARRERGIAQSIEQPKPIPSSLDVAEQLVKKNQATLPGYDPDTGEMTDPDAVFADILANSLEDPNQVITANGLQAAAQGIYGGTLADGTLKRDRLYDAIELGVNTFVTRHPERFAPTGDLASAQTAAADLAELKDRIPTQTVRAGDKEKLQQFSTPPDYAFAAAWAANLKPGEVVIEPSAGTGGIAVHAMNAGAKVVGNEISPQRRAMMATLPFERVTAENAEQLHNILPRDIKPTAVVMNPPFSSAGDRMGGKMVMETGAVHIEQALKRLEPGGRLVAIVGDGMKPEGAETAGKGGRNNATGRAFRDWWKKIGAEYDVRANIGVGGEIYRKYGTTFPTRLLVIDKVAPSGQPPVVTTALTSAELLDALSGVRDARPGSAGEPVADQSSGAPVVEPGQGASGPAGAVRPPTGDVGTGSGQDRPPAPDKPKPAGTGGDQTGGVRSGEGARPTGGVSGDAAPVQQPKPDPQGGTGQPSIQPPTGEVSPGSGPGGDTSHTRPDGSDLAVTPPAPELLETSIVVPEPQTAGELTESVYEDYRPQRISVEGAQPHPGPLVQSAAMASVLPPAVTYKTALPKKLITEGAVSAAQLEAIVYAGNAHSQTLEKDKDGVVKRRGFFIGDGTGVGKGREVAGIILDNEWQGRKKAIWVSEKMPLANDAKRDWSGLGQNPNDILVHNKVKAGDEIKHEGILFTTYDTVKSGQKFAEPKGGYKVGDRVEMFGGGTIVSSRPGTGSTKGETVWTVKFDDGKVVEGTMAEINRPKPGEAGGPKTRVQQIVDWVGKDFDGVIAFDEAHNMANAVGEKGKRGVKDASAKALAGLELQNALPNARVVYVSATGATEVNNLAYADRLGLWGPGTAFANRSDFLSRVASGGVAAMELVARDMKALGYYTARSLSYDGVEYDRVQHDLTPPQRIMYDKIADAWQLVLRNMMQALEDTGADGKGGPKSAILSAFWGGHQRFFNQLITSLQMPSVIEGIDKDLAEGRQAVLQLVNTNEAGQERALDKSKARGDEDLEELDMSPRDQLLQLVDKAFPIWQYESYVDEDGNERVRLVIDSEGNKVANPEAVAAKEKLLLDLGSLRVPDGPLEILINHYGPEAVAEVTGRKRRVVNKPDETGRMKKQEEKRGTEANVAEANSFQSGKKKILVFSQAGGTGRSYHDDKTADRVDDTGRLAMGGNSGARRSHYLVQAGWRADTAVQGFGRTHRTNQWTAPIFHLVTTDLEGQKRFISSIARRLGQLGALTKGERRTGDQGMFGLQDNLESDEAKAGLVQLFRDIFAGNVDGFSTDDLAEQMGLNIVGEAGQLRDELPPMTQFLNRVLSLKVDDQNRVFNEFATRFRDIVDRAAAAGTLDAGTETYKADKITKVSDQVVYTDPNSGAETRHVHLMTSNRNYPTSFGDLMSGQSSRTGWSTPEFFVQNKRSGYISAVTPTTFTKVEPNGQVTEHYRVSTPIDWQYVPKDELDDSLRATGTLNRITNMKEAKTLWDQRVAKTPEFKEADLHIITGAILPIWDRLAGQPKIFRLQTDDGERMLGRVVDNKVINETLTRLGAEAVKLNITPAEVVEKIMGGGVASLANGWIIKRRRVAQEWRLELTGPDLYSHMGELEAAGVFRERIPGSYDTRYFIPTGEGGAATIEAITKRRPIISVEGD